MLSKQVREELCKITGTGFNSIPWKFDSKTKIAVSKFLKKVEEATKTPGNDTIIYGNC